MKINGENIPVNAGLSANPQKINGAEPAEKTVSPLQSPRADRIEISDAARRIAELKAEISMIGDVRDEKVLALKQAIQSGSYSVDAAKIAERILNEL